MTHAPSASASPATGRPAAKEPLRIVFLVGPRAVGKSTLGPGLASRLGWTFTDTDDHIAARTGKDTPAIVEQEGWDGFRRHEALALREAARPFSVIATGGGMVLREDNRAFMRENGLVVYLRAPAEILGQRLLEHGQSESRPSLTGKHPAEEIRDILAEREPLYREASHLAVEASAEARDVLEALVAAVCQSGMIVSGNSSP